MKKKQPLNSANQAWLLQIMAQLAQVPTHSMTWVEKLALEVNGSIRHDGGLGNPLLPCHAGAAYVRNRIGRAGGGNLYGAEGGMAQVKIAATSFFRKIDGVNLTPEQILVEETGSCSLLGFLAEAMALKGGAYVDSIGDLHVLIEAPAYRRHVTSLPSRDIRSHIVDLYANENAGETFAKALENALRKTKSKLVVLSSARNPTTRVITQTELRSAVELCEEHGAVLFVDQAYHHVYREGRGPIPSVLGLDGVQDKMVCATFTASKGHQSPTGGGLLLGHPELIRMTAGIRRNKREGGSVSQQIGLALLLRDSGYLGFVRKSYDDYFDYLTKSWTAAGWPIEVSDSSIFIYEDIPEVMMDAGYDSKSFVTALARKGVVVYPGEFFPGGNNKMKVRICARGNKATIDYGAEVIRELTKNPPSLPGWPV